MSAIVSVKTFMGGGHSSCKGSWHEYRNLGYQFFAFRTWNTNLLFSSVFHSSLSAHVSGRAPTPGPCGLLLLGIWCLGNVWPHLKSLPMFTSYQAHTDQEYQIFPWFLSLFFFAKLQADPLFALTWDSGLWPVNYPLFSKSDLSLSHRSLQ